MAIKAIQDFVQGDTFKVKIRHNPIVDIRGAVLELILNKTETDSPALYVTHTVPNGTDGVNGIAYINVTAEDTLGVPAGKYYVTLKRTIGTDVTTIIRTGLYNVGKVECFKNLDIE